MALIKVEKNRAVNYSATITVDQQPVCSISASINAQDPEYVIGLNPQYQNSVLYRANREPIQEEIKTFENEVFAEQDKMIAEKAAIAAKTGGNK